MPTAEYLPQAEEARANDFPVPGDPLSRRDWTLALGVALLAGLIHLLLANQRGFWGDEYLTVLSTRLGLLDQCRERLAAGHSPLYFLYVRLGLFFGESERAFRFPSALATVFTILGLTGLAGALGWRRLLPTLWGLALVQPFWITLGTQARYMMPLMAEAAFTTWAAVAYARGFQWRRGALLALATGLLLWTHSSAQFFVLGLLIFLAWEARERLPRGWTSLPAVAARLWPVPLGMLGSAPLLYLTRNHNSKSKADYPGLSDFLRDICEVLFGDYKLWPRVLHWPTWPVQLFALALLAAVAVLAVRALRSRRQATAERLLTALAVFTPLGFYLFCGLVRNFGSPARYISLLGLPVLFAMAAAWHAPLRRPGLRTVFRVALAGFLCVQAAATALDRYDHHREACRWIVRHATPDVSVVLVSGPANLLGLKMNGLKDNIDVFVRDSSRPETSSFPRLLESALKRHSRVIFINYFSPSSVVDDVDAMLHDKTIAARRRWKLGLKTTVGAFVRDERDRAWLEGLPKPEKDWGPARFE